MAFVQHISPALPLPPQLLEVAGLCAESYINPAGREFLIVCAWGKAAGHEQVAFIACFFSDEQVRAGLPGRQPTWEAIDLPTDSRGILNAELSLYTGQLRLVITTDRGDGNVRKQRLHIVSLNAFGIED